MRIAYFVHGRGRGHASRSSSVIRRLRDEGHEVRVLGGGDAATVFARDGAFTDIGVSRLSPRGLVPLGRRLFRLHRELSDFPQIVVSDGDLAGLLFAWLRSVPSITLAHGLVFSTIELPRDLPKRALFRERAKAWLYVELAHHVVPVHFLPARVVHPRAVLARPEEAAGQRAESGAQPRAVAYFRYGDGAPYVRALHERGVEVSVFADRIGELPPGVELHPPGPLFTERFAQADFVVGSSGSNLITECVYAGKPLLALHLDDDSEQKLNGILAERARIAVSASFGAAAPPLVDRLLRLDSKSAAIADELRRDVRTAAEVVAELARRVALESTS